ncbi:MAG: ATP-binding protein [Chloroflexi bacterium]|nr:ATP-binding protein [Chloroflexota bacterium]
MGSLARIWQRIGTKLYIALGFAVLLTLVSSAVGVYYFERSGDLNYQASSESVPALEASWQATREAERLRSIGMELLAETQSSNHAIEGGAVSESLKRLDNSLGTAGSVPELAAYAQTTQEAAYELTGIIDNLMINRTAALEADLAAKELQDRIDAVSVEDAPSLMALLALKRASLADDEIALEHEWDAFAELHARGIDESVAALAEREGVFAVRSQQLALRAQADDLAESFSESSAALDNSLTTFLSNAGSQSSSTLGLAVSSFDQGRLLLTIISVVSVVAATLAAWLWVGNGMVRRLSRMSDRMRNMAGGDLETPVPEIGEDEIGELANALEVFRQQALEVQRLNLVEKLYGELREANEELKQMQARLVAQEKLAALGELVSGVAHEISNPLNFVTNFSEGSLELYDELSEMLDTYKAGMSEDDVELLEEISGEISDSLNRVCVNGGRALAIVERMRAMGVEGGEPVPVDMNAMLPQIVNTGCEAFESQWKEFSVERVFDLDSRVGEVPLAEHDFGEAIVNIVSNACYAMLMRKEESGDSYNPMLHISSRRDIEESGMVEVRIRDNGTGISEDVLGHIFNPFFSTRDGALGAGLGLPIAADVARRLGGHLTVDTAFGEFTEFTLTIPSASKIPAAVEED